MDGRGRIVDPLEMGAVVEELAQGFFVEASDLSLQFFCWGVRKSRPRLAHDVLFVSLGTISQLSQDRWQATEIERFADGKLHFLNLSRVVVGVMHQHLEVGS